MAYACPLYTPVYNAYTNDDLQRMRRAYYAITYLCLFTRLFLSISRE